MNKVEKAAGLKEPHYCKTCGKLITEFFGSGNYCCRSCANKRVVTSVTKEAIKAGMEKSKKGSNYLDNISEGKSISNIISHSGYYHGVFCASTGELAYYIYCIENEIKIERCKDYFLYKYKGEIHKYLPDGYLPDENKYIEIKGLVKVFDSSKVLAKAKAMDKYGLNYEIIANDKIKPYLQYCKHKYNTEHLETLYDDHILLEKQSKKHSPRTANYKGINNGEESTLVSFDTLDHYLQLGWSVGRIKTNKMIIAGEKQKELTSNKVIKPKIYTNEFRKGKKQIYLGDTRMFVLPEELPSYLENGGKLGTGHKQSSSHHSGGNHKSK